MVIRSELPASQRSVRRTQKPRPGEEEGTSHPTKEDAPDGWTLSQASRPNDLGADSRVRRVRRPKPPTFGLSPYNWPASDSAWRSVFQSPGATQTYHPAAMGSIGFSRKFRQSTKLVHRWKQRALV